MKKIQSTKSSGQTHFLIIIFFLIAGLMISSAIIELQQSKEELYSLMDKQSHSLLQSLIIASKNTLRASTYLDDMVKERLLNNAVMIKTMYEKDNIDNETLSEICGTNQIFGIQIFNRNGHKIFSSHLSPSGIDSSAFNSKQFLQPIFSGEQDTLQIGYRESRSRTGFRFVVAIASKDRSAIVLNIDASEMLKFKRDIDFGALIRQVTRGNPEIIYIALQDTIDILAASGNIKYLDKPTQSEFLSTSIRDSSFKTRTLDFDSIEVFETVHPFIADDQIIGLFRLGLSLKPIEDINKRIYRRLVIITFILIIIGFVLFVYLFTRQRLNLLQKQYLAIETYSSNIISNVSDAIIVLDGGKCIKIFNDAAIKLFKQDRTTMLGKNLESIFSSDQYIEIMEESSLLKQMECQVNGVKLSLLISKSIFEESDGSRNTILVIRDLTEQKQLQAQLERKQRLTAMGELASGVAHEIRNPLNTIGTIVQQLNKDFEPQNNSGEYHELAELVHSEVKRINDTVQDFLRFARPEPIAPSEFSISVFFRQLQIQYQAIFENHNISFKLTSGYNENVVWDERKMKQVFINLLQNSIDAIGKDGQIEITVSPAEKGELEIKFHDNGTGIDPKIQDKIFNLYFTTKAKGTGIGLSIVQRIIYEHGGIIHIDSDNKKRGTTFIILLPIIYDPMDA